MPSQTVSTGCRNTTGRSRLVLDRMGPFCMGRRSVRWCAGAASLRPATFGRKALEWVRCARGGQGTVEYAVVFAALLAMAVGLGAMWRLFDGGTVVQHALQSASHHVQSAAAGAIGDVFQY